MIPANKLTGRRSVEGAAHAIDALQSEVANSAPSVGIGVHIVFAWFPGQVGVVSKVRDPQHQIIPYGCRVTSKPPHALRGRVINVRKIPESATAQTLPVIQDYIRRSVRSA